MDKQTLLPIGTRVRTFLFGSAPEGYSGMGQIVGHAEDVGFPNKGERIKRGGPRRWRWQHEGETYWAMSGPYIVRRDGDGEHAFFGVSPNSIETIR